LSNDRPDDKIDGDDLKVNSASKPQQNLNEFAETQSSKYASNLVNEGILAGQRIAKISVITLIAIGIVELITGFLSGSVVATAEGIDSISDAMISLIVLLGLS
jgi:Co/Zn/Cd efflux system component